MILVQGIKCFGFVNPVKRCLGGALTMKCSDTAKA